MDGILTFTIVVYIFSIFFIFEYIFYLYEICLPIFLQNITVISNLHRILKINYDIENIWLHDWKL